MGCFFSSFLTVVDDGRSPTAMVVAPDCNLLEYSGGITAAEVVVETGQNYVLCCSDKLFFDSYPQAVPPDEELEPGQIYFLLPVTELQRRLTGENVAALAIRASTALKRAAEKQGKRRKIWVGPGEEVFDGEVDGGNGDSKWWRTAAMMTSERKKKYTRLVGKGSVGLRRKLSAVEEVEEDSVDMFLVSR